MRHSRLSACSRATSAHCGQRWGSATLLGLLLLCLCSAPASAQTATPGVFPGTPISPRLPTGEKPAPASDLGQRIDAILARPEVARGYWGIEIDELEGGRILYSHYADRLFAPASNAKVFVTAAALALIGNGYRMQTTVEAAAPP